MKQFILFFVLLFCVTSCEKEKVEVRHKINELLDFRKIDDNLKLATFNANDFEKIFIHKKLFNTENIFFVNNFRSDRLNDNLYETKFPLSIVNSDKLNYYLKKMNPDIQIIGLNGFHNSSDNLVGFGIFIYSKSSKSLEYYLFTKKNSQFVILNGFPKKTIDTDLRDIIHLLLL